MTRERSMPFLHETKHRVRLPAIVAWCATMTLVPCGCRTETASASAGKHGASDLADETAKTVPRLERQLQVANDRAGVARVQEREQEAANAHAAARVEAELKDLEDQLAELERVSGPARVAKAKLDLALARDALAEQEEELAQLEMTYKAGDLADKTSEIVLTRGKRHVERAKEKLELETKDEQALEEAVLPHEHDKLVRQIALKQHDLERAHHDGDVQMQEKHIAVEAADLEVMRAQTELASAHDRSAK